MPRRQDDVDDEGFGEASRYTAHLDRGWSLLDRGDLQQARNSAHQAMKIRPDVPDGAMLMAAISLAEADPESSLEWYERAIDADSEYVDAQLAAAQILLYDLDDPHRALTRAEFARELDEATVADQLDLGVLELEALVSLGDLDGARERLAKLSELGVLERMLSPETPREELRELLAQFLGEPFDGDEDWDPVVQRAVQLAIRVARLHMDLGTPELATPWLERLLRTFGDDPDIWYLTNEAAYVAGEPVKAAQAALQVLQLDAGAPLPDWAPSPSELHAKVVDLLLKSVDPLLRELARAPGFAILVNDAPPFELVLEGVDPRLRSLALAARNARDSEAALALTGLALYRRNLVRLARDRVALEREVELAVFDELAVFFGFDDVRRERLGLAPSEWSSNTGDPRASRRDGEHDDGRRKPGKPALVEPEPNKSSKRKRKAASKKSASKKSASKKPASSKPSKTPAGKRASKKPASKRASKKRASKTPASNKPSKTPASKQAKPKPGKRKQASKPSKLLDGKAKPKAKPDDKPRKRDEPLDE